MDPAEAIGVIKKIMMQVDWRALYIQIRNAAITLNFILLAIFLYILRKAYSVRPKLIPLRKLEVKTLTLKSQALKDRWQVIVKKADAAPPQSYSFAIIEADSFVDDALKRMGLKGEHMADRLERINADEVRSLNKLWTAHRIRNDIVHTPGFRISEEEARKLLSYYEEFLREIGVI